MPERSPIRRALISVYDKTGVVDFARALHDEFGVEVISTGGTARTLAEAGIPVTLVEAITGFPEMLDGRVKTLHPKIHAAILADRDNPEHMRQLDAAGIEPIDMVVVNLYPFEKTVADPNCTFEQAIEMIDIGGPCLLRAAAKNNRHVVVVPHAEWYPLVTDLLSNRSAVDLTSLRLELAKFTFVTTRKYDHRIWDYLSSEPAHQGNVDLRTDQFGSSYFLAIFRDRLLTYGENPHQSGALYSGFEGIGLLGDPPALSNPRLSFNNYVDASAALELCAELTRAGNVTAGGASAGKGATALWYRLPAGFGVQPASSRRHADDKKLPADRVQGETQSRRYLPHIQNPGRSYFVTFRTKNVLLPPEARSLVLSACRHWHGRKMTLHAAVVMPDHVHLLLTPWLYPDGSAVALSELSHSIKSYSSNQVNQLIGRRGPLWMQERWDRIMRHEQEFAETWEYICTNPERAGLGEKYEGIWTSETGFEEGGWVETTETSRLEAGSTRNRLEADTTRERASPAAGGPVACVFIKHTNACGVGVVGSSDGQASTRTAAAARVEAYRRAYLGDPNAAMGGILAVNFPVDAEFAATVMETYARFGKPLREAGLGGRPHPNPPAAFFIEVWIAPRFTDDALAVIRGTYDAGKAGPDATVGETVLDSPAPKKDWGSRVRLLAVGDMAAEPDPGEMDLRKIAGGVLMQTPDLLGLNEEQWKVVTKRPPDEREMADLRLAWLVCKHTKSNAITLCRDGMLIGNGAGQMSRVMSCRIAAWLARENGHLGAGNREQGAGNRGEGSGIGDRGSGAEDATSQPEDHPPVAASDAFFPFRDGVDVLIDAGVSAIIQPGGSKRDDEVIGACDERGIAMIFTGTRHFRH